MAIIERFPDVLNMSITASVAIGFVVLARLGLKKSPKVFSYALWSVVLFRLLCPVSISVDFSVFHLAQIPAEVVSENTTTVEFLSEELVFPGAHLAELPRETPDAPAIPAERHIDMGALWLTGVGIMVLWGLWSLLWLGKKLRESAPLGGNIWEADGLETAFVLGLLRPRIYLPSGLRCRDQEFILLHEKHHVKRLDHLWKLAAFFALCIHWFNPAVWLAFYLAQRDMEMSCDEAVLKQLGTESRCDYSQTLLRVSSGRRWRLTMPLAFGEGNVKERVVNVLNWKKPRLWVSIVCGMVCVALLAACGGNPGVETTVPPESAVEATSPDVSGTAPDLQSDPVSVQDLRTRTVRADFTDYANIQLELPESWDYEIVEQTLETDAWGIRFWPKDYPDGMIELCWYPSGFGVCGTGLAEVTLVLDNGDSANLGYYDGSDAMSFCVFAMDYAAVNVSAYDCWEEYGETVLNILRSVQVNQGVITEQDARNQIAYSGLLEEHWELYRADFDPVEGVWTFRFYEDNYNDAVQVLCVDHQGNCWRHGEISRDDGHHHDDQHDDHHHES